MKSPHRSSRSAPHQAHHASLQEPEGGLAKGWLVILVLFLLGGWLVLSDRGQLLLGKFMPPPPASETLPQEQLEAERLAKERPVRLPSSAEEPLAQRHQQAAEAEVYQVRLNEHFHSEDFRVAVSHSLKTLALRPSPPEGQGRLPDHLPGKTLYTELWLGSEPIAFPLALYFAAGESQRPLLYLDRNRNGDFGDDGDPLSNQGSGLFAALVTLPLRDIAPQWQGDDEYRIWLFTNDSLWKNQQLSYYARTQLVGRLLVEGWDLLAVVADRGVHDGDFTNDGIYLDLNRDGKIDTEEEYIAPQHARTLRHTPYRFVIRW